MADKGVRKNSAGGLLLIGVGVVLLIGAAISGSKLLQLNSRLAEIDAQLPAGSQFAINITGEPLPYAELRAQRYAVLEERYDAQNALDIWLRILGIFAFICVLAWVITIVDRALREAQAARRQRIEANEDVPFSAHVTSAAEAIGKVLPRQPTVGKNGLSTADELRKWNSLKDEGLVTEEEFQKMREKLLG